MQTTMKPKIKPRERILIYGSGGVGKSEAGLAIVAAVPDAHHYSLDLDVTPSYERMLATKFSDVGERGNFTVMEYEPTDWSPIVPQINEWAARSTEDDWLVIDPITPTWDAVRAWYLDFTMNAPEMADFLAQLRRDNNGNKAYMKAIQDTMNYDLINRQYFKLYAALRRWRGHVLLTAEAATVRDDATKEIRQQFQAYGAMPQGQKKLSHIPATILLATKGRVGEYFLTTIKDRGRAEMVEQRIENFTDDYLRAVAGWTRSLVKAA